MCKETLSALEFDASTRKRAQYEAFDFELEAPGLVTVRNESYENADEHSYCVNVENGRHDLERGRIEEGISGLT